MNNSIKIPIVFIWLMGLIMGAAIGAAIIRYSSEYRQGIEARRTVLWMDYFFQMKRGYINEIGEYDIASFDCGRNWYNVKIIEEEPLKTELGYVAQHGFTVLDKVDPDVLKKIFAFQIFNNYIITKKSSTIDPLSPEFQAAIKDTGITVEKVK